MKNKRIASAPLKMLFRGDSKRVLLQVSQICTSIICPFTSMSVISRSTVPMYVLGTSSLVKVFTVVVLPE